MSLHNARVLIIGGTSGIGLGVALAVADHGGVPIVVSRRQSSVDRALTHLPPGAIGTTVDLGDAGALDRLTEEVGDIDHLVYTAGEPLEFTGLADLTPEVITGFFHTRFVGAVSAVRAFRSRIRPGGSVTLTSGTAAWQPRFGVLPVALCGAMNAVTTALAVEIAPIRVNAVAPGLSRTPLWDTLSDADRETLYDEESHRIPLGRVGEVEDIARAYVYCMEQDFSTGMVLTVEGGILLV